MQTQTLLKAIVNALNQIPNRKLTGNFKDSYSIASAIDRHLERPTLPDFTPAAGNLIAKDVTSNPAKFTDESKTEITKCEAKDADFFSVYLRGENDLLHCIADFETQEQADNFERLISNIVRNLKTAPPKDNGFNNASFQAAMIEEFSNYSNLSYSLEKCEDENNLWELAITSSSSSELDGSEEGELGRYGYIEAREAIEDLQTAEARHGTKFDEV